MSADVDPVKLAEALIRLAEYDRKSRRRTTVGRRLRLVGHLALAVTPFGMLDDGPWPKW